MNTNNTVKLAKMGMLVAISIVLLYFTHFPIFPQVAFLEYDMADVPIFIGGFAFGPMAGLALTAVACVIQGMTVSSASGVIGIIMHFFATGSFVLVSSVIYKKNKTRKRAALALLFGACVMVATMALWNLIFTPIFMGVPRSAVIALFPFIIAFNVIKAGVNSIITFFVYKPISRFLHK